MQVQKLEMLRRKKKPIEITHTHNKFKQNIRFTHNRFQTQESHTAGRQRGVA